MKGASVQFDLVLLSLGGVQRFISESRSAADVAGASKIVQKLAKIAAEAAQQRLAGSPAPSGLIFPATADAPIRIVPKHLTPKGV